MGHIRSGVAFGAGWVYGFRFPELIFSNYCEDRLLPNVKARIVLAGEFL